jgi:hypothetical protein
MSHPFPSPLVRHIARECGLFHRRARKIDTTTLLTCLVRAASLRTVSLALLGTLLGGVSAVAVYKRIGPQCVAWLRAVFAAVACAGSNKLALPGFAGRILVQDSTVIGLPASCRNAYRGAANQRGSRPQARLQCVLDLVRAAIVWTRYDDFRRNDQRSASADLPAFARRGDLLVRDRGYFTVQAIIAAGAAGVDLLTRWRFGTGLWVAALGQWRPVQLEKVLREGDWMDRQVWVGNDHVPMRLVCVPLGAAHAAQRRRVARQDRDQRLAHSRAYYHLLGWAIFLTTVPKARLSARRIALLYRLRWRIEIVFKAAKSSAWTRELPTRASLHLVESLIWARLLALWLQLRHLQGLALPQPHSLLRHAIIFNLLLAELLPLPAISRAALRRFISQPRRRDRLRFHDIFRLIFPLHASQG